MRHRSTLAGSMKRSYCWFILMTSQWEAWQRDTCVLIRERCGQCSALIRLVVQYISQDNGLFLWLSWWRHQMETFSALLAICVWNSPVTGEFPAHRPVTRSFDVSFDLRLNNKLSKQWWGWWFGTSSRPSWRHCNTFSVNVGDAFRHTIHCCCTGTWSIVSLCQCQWNNFYLV